MASTSVDEAKLDQQLGMNKAVDAYMKFFVKVAAMFMEGLAFQRSSTKTALAMDCSEGTIPKLNDTMVDYIATQIFPLEGLYKEKSSVDVSTQPVQPYLVTFEAVMKQLPISTQCGPKLYNDSAVESLKYVRFTVVDFLNNYVNLFDAKEIPTEQRAYSIWLLRLLTNLAHRNDPAVSGLKALTNPYYADLVRIFVWVISAYTDWLDIDVVEPADILAATYLVTANVKFPLGRQASQGTKSVAISREAFISSMTSTSNKANVMIMLKNNASLLDNIFEEIYEVCVANNLYISEPALRKLAFTIVNLLVEDKVLQEIIQYNQFLTYIRIKQSK